MNATHPPSFAVFPIGHVEQKDGEAAIHIDEQYRDGLDKMDRFSHFLVLWWANGQDVPERRNILQTPLPYAEGLTAGVFACRAEYRPNPIGVTVCEWLEMDREHGIIRVPYIDAFDRTPVLDLKPYFPVSERVREARVPEWVHDWPQWYEESYKLAEIFAPGGEDK